MRRSSSDPGWTTALVSSCRPLSLMAMFTYGTMSGAKREEEEDLGRQKEPSSLLGIIPHAKHIDVISFLMVAKKTFVNLKVTHVIFYTGWTH